MAITLNDNLQINAGKPTDTRYLNGAVPYVSTTEVNSLISNSLRYIGLTVKIGSEEYWYNDGVSDTDLVKKLSNTSEDLQTVSNKSASYNIDRIGNIHLNNVLELGEEPVLIKISNLDTSTFATQGSLEIGFKDSQFGTGTGFCLNLNISDTAAQKISSFKFDNDNFVSVRQITGIDFIKSSSIYVTESLNKTLVSDFNNTTNINKMGKFDVTDSSISTQVSAEYYDTNTGFVAGSYWSIENESYIGTRNDINTVKKSISFSPIGIDDINSNIVIENVNTDFNNSIKIEPYSISANLLVGSSLSNGYAQTLTMTPSTFKIENITYTNGTSIGKGTIELTPGNFTIERESTTGTGVENRFIMSNLSADLYFKNNYLTIADNGFLVSIENTPTHSIFQMSFDNDNTYFLMQGENNVSTGQFTQLEIDGRLKVNHLLDAESDYTNKDLVLVDSNGRFYRNQIANKYNINLYANTDSTVSNMFPLFGKINLTGSLNKTSNVTQVFYQVSTDGGSTWTTLSDSNPANNFTVLQTWLSTNTNSGTFVLLRAVFTFNPSYLGEQVINLQYTDN